MVLHGPFFTRQENLGLRSTIMDNNNLTNKIVETTNERGTLETPMVQHGCKTFEDYFAVVMCVVAIAMSFFHVCTAFIGALPAMEQRSAHLGFALILVFMQSFLKDKSPIKRTITAIFLVGAVATSLYAYFLWEDMNGRVAFPIRTDLFFAGVLTLCILEATRRKLGGILAGLGVFFILYAHFGRYFPKMISHRGYSFERILSYIYMDTFGAYGQVIGISATYIFLFILFGAFLEQSGAGRFFIDLATACVGKQRGGSAKVATVSCCLFGMVSGSAPANVMAVGPLTVPMMVEPGYSKRFSGAVVSVAGTGGQFMPPIMGSAAFIIAETLGLPYLRIATAAFIPGVLYYLAIIFAIDCRSNKMNMKGLDVVPNAWEVLKKGFYLATPVILLIYGLAIARWSPIKSGLYSIIAMFLVSWCRKDTRMGIKKTAKAFEAAAMGSLEVVCVCALAGIMIGMLSLTGLGLKFSSLLVSLSGGYLIVLLILTMIAGLILGMGMTTTSVYIILSVLVAPALVEMGVSPLSAHLFVFYFGILSAITPPVATASYAAASVAMDDPMKLGFVAWRLGLSGYILPFIFIFSPELLMEGSILQILLATITATIGIFSLSLSLEGFYKYELNMMHRILLFIGALCLIYSGWLTDIIGLAVLALFAGPQYLKARKSKQNMSVIS